MIVKSFTGRNTAEALAKVRQSLGDAALIIETKQISDPGLFGKKIGVEVIAAIDSAETNTASVAPIQKSPNKNFKRVDSLGRQDNSTTSIMPYQFTQDQKSARIKNEWEPIQLDQTHIPGLTSTPSLSASQLQPEQIHQHIQNTEKEIEEIDQSLIQQMSGRSETISQELSSIRRQLARLASGQSQNYNALGEELLQQLEDMELPSDCIAELEESINQAGDRLPTEKRNEFCKLVLKRALTISGGMDWSQCKHLLVVGPTGVGKTTSIAKIAGDLVLRQGKKVALVTIDTYRIGAADQIHTYADLLDIPCAVASSPSQLEEHCKRFQAYDVILIDTAGRSPADTARVNELRSYCKQIPGMQVMLAIAATCGRAEFAGIVERFSLLPIEHLLLTKLDENQAPGRLYGCLRRHQLPLRYIGCGQEVPDDLKNAEASQIVDPLFETSTVV